MAQNAFLILGILLTLCTISSWNIYISLLFCEVNFVLISFNSNKLNIKTETTAWLSNYYYVCEVVHSFYCKLLIVCKSNVIRITLHYSSAQRISFVNLIKLIYNCDSKTERDSWNYSKICSVIFLFYKRTRAFRSI